MRGYGAIGLAVLVALWAIAAYSGLFNRLLVPTPPSVLMAILSLLGSGAGWADLGFTVYRTIAGFLIAVFVGVPLGLLFGQYRRLHAASVVTVDFLRSLPVTALFPVFMLFFGLGDLGKILICTFGSSLVILVNSVYGVQSGKQLRTLLARGMGASRGTIFFRVVLPQAMPHIAAGLRTGLSLSLILVVVGEMLIGSHTGLGHRIMDAHLSLRIPEMYAAIVLTGLLGYGLNSLWIMGERRMLHWSGR